MLQLVKYESQNKTVWDEFVKNAKNGHFMFLRDYMDYHADRFIDHSLLAFKDNKLIAVMPANQKDNLLISHGGLTFGSLVVDVNMKAQLMLDIFSSLRDYLQSKNISCLHYKVVPHIYHTYPAEEDLYALQINNASLLKREITSTIKLANRLRLSGGKKNGIAKAIKQNIVLLQSNDYAAFVAILNQILGSKYQTKATHSVTEIDLLCNRFPNNIKLYGAFNDNEMCAGVILYITQTVVHVQYIATTEEGREFGALDYLLANLMDTYSTFDYFDFGISTEQAGKYLNQGLIAQKEMFGARAIVHDTYEMKI